MQCIIMENILIKLTLHDETKKMAHDSQIVRAKENLKLSHGGNHLTEKENWVLCLNYVLAVVCMLVFCVYSSWYPGLVCGRCISWSN